MGRPRQGKQRSCCQETVCDGRTFLLEYSYAGHSAEIKQQIVDMAMNASGIRDTARVGRVPPAADKYHRLTRRLSQEQKGLDERALIASQRPSHPW